MEYNLRARSGITYLRQYLSKGRQRKVSDALSDLNRAVVVPAVDFGLQWRIEKFYAGLDARRDNKSVTESEWAEKGIWRYGCPIHSNLPATDPTSVSIPGYGPCSCDRDQRVAGPSGRSTGARSSQEGERIEGSEDPDIGDKFDDGRRPSVLSVGDRDRGASLAVDPVRDSSRRRVGPWRSLSYEHAVRSVYDTAGAKEGGRQPLSVDEVVDHHIDLNAYAGAPYFEHNRDVLDQARRHARMVISGDRGFDPYVFGRRVSHGTSGPKTRLVWMASLCTTIVGTRFSKPILSELEGRRPFCWGLRNFEKGPIITELESRFRYVYSLDFSKFDSSVPARMIDDAFQVVKTHLELDEVDDAVWYRFVNDFIHTRIIAPDGGVYQVHKGVPSGNAFTSILGSVINLILISYMWHKITGHSLPHDRVLVMGDDVVVASNTRLELSDLASAASDLGFTLSVEKSDVVDTKKERTDFFENRTHFLGHYWFIGDPHRPDHELLQRMAFPEHHRKRTDDESIIRLLGYQTTCYEGDKIFREIYDDPDGTQAYLRALRDATEDGKVTIPLKDLPGQLRLIAKVEGRSVEEIVRRGLAVALFGRLII